MPRGARPMDEKAKASLKSRIIVAAVLIAIAIPTIFVGSYLFFFVMLAFLLIAVHEMIKAPGKKYGWWVYAVSYFFAVILYGWFIFKQNMAEYIYGTGDFTFSLERYFSTLNVPLFGIIGMLALLFLIAVCDKNFGFDDLAYFALMILVLGIGFQALCFVRYYPFYQYTYDPAYSTYSVLFGVSGTGLLDLSSFRYAMSAALFIYVLLGPVFNDTFAYFIGSAFGHRQLNARISPKKTWEGFIGGWVLSTILTFGFGIAMAACGYPILPSLDLEHWYWILALSFLMPAFANLGDLSFSLIKRHYEIKDFGTILRGHGGILDRADSLVFTFAGAAVLLVLISGNWNLFALA